MSEQSSLHETIRAVDLFCGAGGLSWGLVEALKSVAITADKPTDEFLEQTIDLVGVNHWDRAIETHERNHPWARQIHDDIQHVNPREVFDEPDPDVKVLSGGIECTHFSTARGGKPVNEQKRMPAWDFLNWVQKLRPENVLVENVPEFEKWGPVDDDGNPSRNGEIFEQWINSLHSLGYSVDWDVLNAADYGDATSRKRLFILGKRNGSPKFPEPTHSEDGEGDTEEWRPAADIIDWSDPGMSIWTRDEDHPRVHKPPASTTFERIAEGIRRYNHEDLEPFADAIGDFSPDRVRTLREDAVSIEDAAAAAESREEPFFVYGPVVEPIEDTSETRHGLCVPYLLGQHGGAVARDVTESPCPTIATKGAIGFYQPQTYVLPRLGYHRGDDSNPAYPADQRPLHVVTSQNHDGHTFTPYLVPFYGERSGQSPRTHDVDAPVPTIPASKSPAGVCRPFLVTYYGQSDANSVEKPLPTVTTKDRFALCIPELYPWGIDIRFRMLQPRELAQAQGFPPDYDFSGTKTETTEQIGNAVPVNLAQSLVESLLSSSLPALTDFLDEDPVLSPSESNTSTSPNESIPSDD